MIDQGQTSPRVPDGTIGNKSINDNIITFLDNHRNLLPYIYKAYQEDENWKNSLTEIEQKFIEENPRYVSNPFSDDLDEHTLAQLWDGTSIGWLSKDAINSKQELDRPVYVYEVVLYRYLVYLSEKNYGVDGFIARSDRLLNYFEYQDIHLLDFDNPSNIQDAVSNYQFGDLFYFRASHLFTARSLVVPIFYQNYLHKYDYQDKFKSDKLTDWDYLNDGPGLQFDLIDLPQHTEFEYINYNIEKQLVLGKAFWPVTRPSDYQSKYSKKTINLRSIYCRKKTR